MGSWERLWDHETQVIHAFLSAELWSLFFFPPTLSIPPQGKNTFPRSSSSGGAGAISLRADLGLLLKSNGLERQFAWKEKRR